MLGSKRAGPGASESAAQRLAAASASSVLYTVAKLMVGSPGRRRSNSSCAVGCVGSAASSRTMAIRCGVSLSPDARTHDSISATRSTGAPGDAAGAPDDDDLRRWAALRMVPL